MLIDNVVLNQEIQSLPETRERKESGMFLVQLIQLLVELLTVVCRKYLKPNCVGTSYT